MKYLQFSHTLAVVAVSLALVSVGDLGWLGSGFIGHRTALAELQFTYDDAVQKNAYAASVRALLRDIDRERTELNAITQGYDPVETIRIIEEAARAARVTITVNAVTPSMPAPEDPTLSSFLVNINVSGTFAGMYQFTSLMETLPLPAEVEQAQFERVEKMWSGDMIIRIYMDSANEN